MTAESISDEQMLRDLAQRLLSHPHPDGPTSVELFLRRLPESLAVDIPLPPASRLVGSALHSRKKRPTLIEAVFDAELAPEEVVAAYERVLAEHGWKAFEQFGGMGGGFVPGGVGIARAFRHGDEGPVLMVAATTGDPKRTDLRLRLDWEIIRHLPEMRMHGRPEGVERMPALHPPYGMPLRGGGGGGNGASWHSEASLETDLPAAELQSHFAKQLERARWTRVAGSADDVVAWSSWQLPGGGGWNGILLVLGARPGERFLYVRIEANEPRDDGGHISSMSSYQG
jgi:hypothetical protein